MNVLGYLQRIGRALMVPVAVLPAAAIMMGIGYWIDPAGWGDKSALAAFLIQAGGAIIEKMPILFAVGVAYGMSKDKDGAAALAGLVGYLVLTTLLKPTVFAQIQSIPLDLVPAAFQKVENQFVGILCGVIAAELYNRFSAVELHKTLSFFSGRRLVPIVTSAVMILMAFVMMWVWPYVFGGLVHFGQMIAKMDAMGAGIYGFFNRLLIPVGLHHALNSVFWFDVAGINDIPNFLAGKKALAEGIATLGITGRYQAGFFPIMMFGLPAAGFAIYRAARPEHKVRVASLMLAAGFASFFTGITEPLEFSFMFVAPVLYILHALLTGVSVFIAAQMQWISGFGFSAGLVDMALSARNPLAKDWFMLIPQGLVFSAIYYFGFRFAILALNLKTPGREEDLASCSTSVKRSGASEPSSFVLPSDDVAHLAETFLAIIGGKENVQEIDACISRLRLSLKDTSLIDEAAAKKAGAAGVMKLDAHNVQIVLGLRSEKISEAIKSLMTH